MSHAPRATLAVVLAAAALAACGDAGGGSQTDRPAVEDPGPVHVHGLGVNPADGALLIATHTGLFRAPPGDQRATRVGDRYQDTMGFTVVGPDHFLGSGHPDGRDRLPPFLGLVESRDAGRSWQPVSLLGKADFHVLEAADRMVYGFGTDFESRRHQFLVSDDGGRTWTERSVPAPLVALAIQPGRAEAIVASDGRRLHASDDAGRSWRALDGRGGLLAWAGGGLHAVNGRGLVFASEDGGVSWERRGNIGGRPAAFEAAGDDLLAALHDGTVKRSVDGGRTWLARSRP